MSKQPKKFKRGDLVNWLQRPQYDYKPGKVSVVRNGSYGGPPLYRINPGPGPFGYYWLDETDLILAGSRPSLTSSIQEPTPKTL